VRDAPQLGHAIAPVAIGTLRYTDFVEVMHGNQSEPVGYSEGERGLARRLDPVRAASHHDRPAMIPWNDFRGVLACPVHPLGDHSHAAMAATITLAS
jgi:hypothetical protein